MSAPDRGPWLQTYTGRRFYPLDPQPADIDIADIAHSLSRLCRFAGHCRDFYSVAQHSVLVSRAVPTEHALWGLLHDASEAYVADLPRPVKILCPEYQAIEERVQQAIARKFRLPWPMPAEVKRADNALLADEAAQLLTREPCDWHLPEPPTGVRISPMGGSFAERVFLERFDELKGPLT